MAFCTGVNWSITRLKLSPICFFHSVVRPLIHRLMDYREFSLISLPEFLQLSVHELALCLKLNPSLGHCLGLPRGEGGAQVYLVTRQS